jgi:hypothetical protein
MWADISAARRFRRSWHARLRRLGLPAMARLHVLGDGASWIWKAAGRALSGCRQTLDIFHASQHIAAAGKRLHGEGTAEATRFHERGRGLLLKEGWTGVCRLIGEELTSEDTPRRRKALDRLLSYFLAHLVERQALNAGSGCHGVPYSEPVRVTRIAARVEYNPWHPKVHQFDPGGLLGRIDYAGRLAAGEAIGSGVVEGAARTLGLRLKARGARWHHKNARAMAALICCRQTDQWDLFWKRAA